MQRDVRQRNCSHEVRPNHGLHDLDSERFRTRNSQEKASADEDQRNCVTARGPLSVQGDLSSDGKQEGECSRAHEQCCVNSAQDRE